MVGKNCEGRIIRQNGADGSRTAHAAACKASRAREGGIIVFAYRFGEVR